MNREHAVEEAEATNDASARELVLSSDPDDLWTDAGSAVPPAGATDVTLVVRHEPGGHLPPPLNHYPNGKGGRTRYGVAFITDWRDTQEPFALYDTHDDAEYVRRLIAEGKETTWRFTRKKEAEPSDDGGGSSLQSDSSDTPTESTSTRSAKTSRGKRASSTSGSSPRSSSSEKSPASSRGSRGRKTRRSSTAAES